MSNPGTVPSGMRTPMRTSNFPEYLNRYGLRHQEGWEAEEDTGENDGILRMSRFGDFRFTPPSREGVYRAKMPVRHFFLVLIEDHLIDSQIIREAGSSEAIADPSDFFMPIELPEEGSRKRFENDPLDTDNELAIYSTSVAEEATKWLIESNERSRHRSDSLHMVIAEKEQYGPEDPSSQRYSTSWYAPLISRIEEARYEALLPSWTTVVYPNDNRKALRVAKGKLAASHRHIIKHPSDIAEFALQEDGLFSLLDYVESQVQLAKKRGETEEEAWRTIRNEQALQARLRDEAINAILSNEMLSEAQAALMLSKGETRPTRFQQYRSRSWLFGLPSADGTKFPKFQFDTKENDIYEVVRTVNQLFDASRNPWSAATWWLFPNVRLSDCPANLVAKTSAGGCIETQGPATGKPISEELIAAARASIGPVG